MAHNKADHLQSVKIIEQCQVSPPPGSAPSSTIPLTFFDLPWVHSYPIQSIWFYDFPHSTDHFMQTALPNLKHSLSHTLQHFFPLASNLALPPQPHCPYITYSDGDSIPFTVAETADDLHRLVDNYTPRDVRDLHPFVPKLPPPRSSQDGTELFPLMAVQVTVLPRSAFAICTTFRQIVADGRSFLHFMKFWARACKARCGFASLEGPVMPLPFLGRDAVEDSKGVKLVYLQELWKSSPEGIKLNDPVPNALSDKVRFTVILSRDRVENLKKWVCGQCKMLGLESGSMHISTFVVTCSLLWTCLGKSEAAASSMNDDHVPNNDEIHKLTILADCRDRLELPASYFGNCLVLRVALLERSKLLGGNGIVEAVISIEGKVRDVQFQALKGVENFMSEYEELSKAERNVVKISGSPKLGVYDTDFGWGKPKKNETLHREYSGSVSLSDCGDNESGVEVSLVLERAQADNFVAILEQQLSNIAICD